MSIKATIPAHRFRAILAGLGYAFLSLGTMAVLVSLLLYFTNMNEQSMHVYTYVIHGMSMVIGGIATGKRIGMKGWYYGGVLGVIYSIVVYLIAFLAFNLPFHFNLLILLLVAFLMGAFGGMIGVNLQE